ncbi:hypothetical protein E1H12_20055 [Geitlerinema sp. P-1104]|uniref:hypothetical protein n=1 Tax=Geitlerinema sp. P-1104 TaxID=2546230 RepID=UPI001476B0B9|nr:hypothetical protein [Geitlerinema sp. P-1104]NMG60740.1 hypothetical protein [Geitlerinema sp. P-1104]
MNPQPEPTPNPDANPPNDKLRQDILLGRKLTLADAIAAEGNNFFKGESPIPILLRAVTEINGFIDKHLRDSSGALKAVLQDWVKQDSRVSEHIDQPLIALEQILTSITTNSEILYEFVRQVDFKWGQIYGDRPYFQKPGQSPHPEDEYTHTSVQTQLVNLLKQVKETP